MPDEGKLAVYCSHSWRPRDVDLNLRVWRELGGACELLVDAPEEPGADPPYYINRIEELLRRTDLFVSVLTYREPSEEQVRCSPYALFEIRLAEQANIPRLVLYERGTNFRPPRNVFAWESYLAFDRGTHDRLPEQRQWTTVIEPKVQQWLEWAKTHRRPASYEQSTCAAILADSRHWEALERCLQPDYEVMRCDPARQTSSEVFRLLREAGLVVAELGTGDAIREQLYAAAHGLGIPAIRMLTSEHVQRGLPWILRGYPGGYQHDIVVSDQDLTAQVAPRSKAMFRLSPALSEDIAADYLQSRRYSQFFVFLSHTLKPPDRTLVERIYTLLKARHVTPFEYHQVNTAGLDWKQALDGFLRKTTQFVVLLSRDYEQSQTCTYEMEQILARGSQVTILPFMLPGRSVPHPKLAHMHNTLLSSEDAQTNAELVVQQVMGTLDAALGRD